MKGGAGPHAPAPHGMRSIHNQPHGYKRGKTAMRGRECGVPTPGLEVTCTERDAVWPTCQASCTAAASVRPRALQRQRPPRQAPAGPPEELKLKQAASRPANTIKLCQLHSPPNSMLGCQLLGCQQRLAIAVPTGGTAGVRSLSRPASACRCDLPLPSLRLGTHEHCTSVYTGCVGACTMRGAGVKAAGGDATRAVITHFIAPCSMEKAHRQAGRTAGAQRRLQRAAPGAAHHMSHIAAARHAAAARLGPARGPSTRKPCFALLLATCVLGLTRCRGKVCRHAAQ